MELGIAKITVNMVHSCREEVAQFSPQRNLDLIGQKLPCDFPCLMAIGEHESDEFHRQGQQFHQASTGCSR